MKRQKKREEGTIGSALFSGALFAVGFLGKREERDDIYGYV